LVLYAFDAAYPPDLATLKAAGGVAVNCYVSGSYAVTPSWVNQVRAAGLGAWPNYERNLWELVSTRVEGAAAARVGIGDAVRCGFPSDGTIWFPFSVDVDVPPARYHQVADAFRGVQDVNAGRYRISCYGQGDLIKYLRSARVITEKGWLSSSYGFPGWDPASGDICVYQLYGDGWLPQRAARHPTINGTDTNIITDPAALGAWWPDGSPYGKGLTMAQLDDLLAAVQALRTDMGNRFQDLIQRIGEPTHPQTDSLRNRLAALASTVPTTDAVAAALQTAVAGLPQAVAAAVGQQAQTPVDVDALAAKIAAAQRPLSGSLTLSPSTPTTATVGAVAPQQQP
jgi:hypothetical protein